MQCIWMYVYHAAFKIRVCCTFNFAAAAAWWTCKTVLLIFIFLSLPVFLHRMVISSIHTFCHIILTYTEEFPNTYYTQHIYMTGSLFSTYRAKWYIWICNANNNVLYFASNPYWLFPYWNHNLLNTFSWCDRAAEKTVLTYFLCEFYSKPEANLMRETKLERERESSKRKNPNKTKDKL